jgi:hypothetical protein
MALKRDDDFELATEGVTELNLLHASGTLDDALEGAELGTPTPIHDLNGEVLYRRIPLSRDDRPIGYTDVASHPAMGSVLVAVSFGTWEPEALLERATEAARGRLRDRRPDEVRFVAFSFPKIGVQFLADGRELALLELFTWRPVPRRKRRSEEPPANFERWSFLDDQPASEIRRRRTRFNRRRNQLDLIPNLRERVLQRVDRREFLAVMSLDLVEFLVDRRVLRYSTRNADHDVCFELRGQETNVWCVAASVQMLLDFYRYEYTQVRLARELGLGTLSNPSGLPYSQDALVVTVLEAMTGNALDATMNTSPSWTEFRSEIRANRPLISFIPGHSRTVAGYTRSGLVLAGLSPFRGLLVYDPWPPNAGVITKWENFDTQTYRRTFTARVTLA